MSKIVIALGGNALGNNPLEQQHLIKKAVDKIIPFIKKGHDIILTHGNGPQVGVINLAFEDSYENKDIPYMPFPECTAMSQGYIGYHVQKEIREAFKENGIEKKVATIITEVVVDKEDEAFQNPTKPVGPFYNKEMAEKLMKETGETYKKEANKGYRKVVASPRPLEIIQIDTIQKLVEEKRVVIACGGGGIPIFKNGKESVSAVIDKDLASSLLAQKLKADMFIILTNIKQVELFYGTPKAQKLGKITVEEAKQYKKEGHFWKGSMLPKIESAISFSQNTGGRSIITALDNIGNIEAGREITEIIGS